MGSWRRRGAWYIEMREIRLPSLGAEMEEGTLLEWYVKPGDRIEYGGVIALLDTDKAEIEMEAFDSGTIESLLIDPGETVAVGTPIATLVEAEAPTLESGTPPIGIAPSGDAAAAGPLPSRPPSSDAAAPAVREARATPAAVVPPETPRSSAPRADHAASDAPRLRATPLARRLARERGIDLRSIAGSGPGGAIVEADVLGAARATPTPTRAPLGREAPSEAASFAADREARSQAADLATAHGARAGSASRVGARAAPRSADRALRRREIIAAAMQRSKREIPHYYLSKRIEIGAALDWLATRNRARAARDRLVLPVLLMKAVAGAARRFPEMNGHWLEDGFHPSERVDLGMVVSLRTGGIVVPTFRGVDQRSLEELAAELRDVVGRARAGRLRSGELGEATITLTSLGEDGAETLFGVIYPPQVAIVGVGGIHPGLHVEGDLRGTRPVVQATLSADHRASDGQSGSRFLQAISKSLSDPEGT